MDVTLTTIIPTNPTTPSTTTTTSTENNIIRIRIKKKTPLKQSKPKTPIPIQSRHFLMTSRFSTETYEQNMLIKKAYNIQCIYGTPTEISKLIPKRNILFILEMNNTKNRIEGIGMVLNSPQIRGQCRHISVYKNGNFNRYIYGGGNGSGNTSGGGVNGVHIRRDTTLSNEEEEIMSFLDIICFKGRYHMKRGNGITSFPKIILKRCKKKLDLLEFIKTMFRSRINNSRPLNPSECVGVSD